MKGGIYTRENCPICGTRMTDNHRTGCSCSDHPEQRARKLILKFPSGSSKYPDIFINFSAGQYENAEKGV
ncbi:MAG: hypothetical protein SVO01_02785 [Thermotogota bacterium]|nr:hypothetical protein [Thermotogota bacterium]